MDRVLRVKKTTDLCLHRISVIWPVSFHLFPTKEQSTRSFHCLLQQCIYETSQDLTRKKQIEKKHAFVQQNLVFAYILTQKSCLNPLLWSPLQLIHNLRCFHSTDYTFSEDSTVVYKLIDISLNFLLDFLHLLGCKKILHLYSSDSWTVI